jgi:hypothetical protein
VDSRWKPDLEADLTSHANDAEQDDLVDFELEQIATQFRLDAASKAQGETGWNMFIRTPGMRKRLYLILIVSFFSQWAGNGIICEQRPSFV